MNNYNPHLHHRRSIRLKGYDYSQNGLYFITICCKDRTHLFGKIENNTPTVGAENLLPNNNMMVLNDAGKIANDCWLQIPNHFPNVILHEYIIMPNHIHGIIELDNSLRTDKTIGDNVSDIDDDIGAENVSVIGDDVIRAENVSVFGDDDDIGVENVSDIDDYDDIRAENILPLRGRERGTMVGVGSVGSIVKGFKIGVTKWMRQNTNVHEVWQRNYYEHIIRNEQSYQMISDYIINNPAKWAEDKFYTE